MSDSIFDTDMYTAGDAKKRLAEYPDDTPLCVVIWGPEDVIEFAEGRGDTCSEERAGKIIKLMKHRHDCEYGITWDTIDYWLDEVGEDYE